MRRTRWCVLAAATVLALAGCGVEGPASPDASPDPSSPLSADQDPIESPEPTMTQESRPQPGQQPRQPSPAPGAGAQPPDTSGVPARYLERVFADAVEHSGVPRERLEVIRAQPEQWRDGSLGCPEPGMMYTMAIVDGYWVELAAAGDVLDYRLDGQGNFRLCDQPRLGTQR